MSDISTEASCSRLDQLTRIFFCSCRTMYDLPSILRYLVKWKCWWIKWKNR